MRYLFLFLVLILISACGSTGMTNQSLLDAPIPKDKSRLVITRDNSLLYMAAGAEVSVNGREIANLGRGAGVIYDVDSGQVYLTMRTLGSSTKFSGSFEVEPKKTYEFTVSPNSGDFWSNTNYTAMFGMLGDSINASVNENSGYFKIELSEIR